MSRGMFRNSVVFSIGGSIYCLIEIAFRGRTHWSMGIAGGVCLCIMYAINKAVRAALWYRAAIAAIAVTAVEFAVGCVVNLKMGLGVWDYSSMPLNIKGQICPLFTGAWFLLSLPGLLLCGKMKESLER